MSGAQAKGDLIHLHSASHKGSVHTGVYDIHFYIVVSGSCQYFSIIQNIRTFHFPKEDL